MTKLIELGIDIKRKRPLPIRSGLLRFPYLTQYPLVYFLLSQLNLLVTVSSLKIKKFILLRKASNHAFFLVFFSAL